MKGGYAGKLLFVDLTTGSIQEETLDEEMARLFIGGYGIGARVLYSRMKPGVDPLGPDNMLGFLAGPLTGTGAFFSGRWTIVCKSPVTGGWNDANSGGFFGPELKKAGYDGVFVSGASDRPVYLWIKDDQVEIRDASMLWGLDAKETQAALEKELDPKVRAACIGPAGEHLSLISAVMNDGHRAAGRGGSGAVMGAKKLKAVAVRGTGEVEVAHPARMREINRSLTAAIKTGGMMGFAGALQEMGTGCFTSGSALSGDSPVKNWGGVGVIDFGEEAATGLGAPALDAKYKVKKYACANCPLGCGAEYEVKGGRWPLAQTERPEYETAAAFGVNMLNADVEALLKCNEICNRAGIDTISAGMTVAWAIECFENEVLNREETGGLELTWGNGEAIVGATQALADGTGFGAILQLGSRGAADKLGKGHEYLQTAQGIELPMHDPRLAPGYARTYQFDPTPGRHVKGSIALAQMAMGPEKYNAEDTGFLEVVLASSTEVQNCVGLCMFAMMAGVQTLNYTMLEAVTGMPFKAIDQTRTGMRIMNMRHVFNLREGIKPVDCDIADRAVGTVPQTAGPLAGATVNAKRLGENFFHWMGWDLETGKPSRRMLELFGGMDDVIQDLYG
jgi:aldehyde:ferredoxin oxidoreductase